MINMIAYLIILMCLSVESLIVQNGPTTKRDSIFDLTYRDTLVTTEEVFCWTRHSDRFIYSATTESNGCQIKCTFWASSSPKYEKYFNSVDIVHYNISDNKPCKGGGSYFCRSGVCIDKDKLRGRALLTIVSGYFPGQDYGSETDAYIEVQVKTKKSASSYIQLGATQVVVDDNYPVFHTTFTSPLVERSGHFHLTAFDRDSSPDDFICSFKIDFNDCKKDETCEKFDGRYEIKYKLDWISEER